MIGRNFNAFFTVKWVTEFLLSLLQIVSYTSDHQKKMTTFENLSFLLISSSSSIFFLCLVYNYSLLSTSIQV